MVRKLVEIAFEPDPQAALRSTEEVAGKAYGIGTREIDARVLLQQGAFTIHSDDKDLADVDFQYPGHTGTPPPWRRAFRVPHGAKKQVRQFLRELGVYESTLFPDLATLAKELRNRPFLGDR